MDYRVQFSVTVFEKLSRDNVRDSVTNSPFYTYKVSRDSVTGA